MTQNNTAVKVADEILTMWRAYERLVSELSTSDNPEGEINCSVLDVLTQFDGSQSDGPQFAISLAAFGCYLKFMLRSHSDKGLALPTEETFRAWYKKE